MRTSVFVVIPNWNGAAELPLAIDSVLQQSHKDLTLVIVDNGSTDTSRAIIEAYQAKDKRVRSIYNDKNYGFTGGVNPGLELAIQEGAAYAALLNNDAVADKHWLERLAGFLDDHDDYGIAACQLLRAGGDIIDSTGDLYSVWGLPYPRGRDEQANGQYNNQTEIFGASGGASLYRLRMLQNIGLFDQDFFAYYEDIDISFRAQLAGWKVRFVPEAVVYHDVGATSTRMGKRATGPAGANTFTTRQYMRNLPFILVKDVPGRLLRRILPRFILAYSLFFTKAMLQGRGLAAWKGMLAFWCKLPKKMRQRRIIQAQCRVTDDYLWSLFLHDLPPNAAKLRSLRARWWQITGRH
jgi:GT2 family glycosyltransferase